MRERGLKFNSRRTKQIIAGGRSREGAWIEISIISGALSNSAVAPVRERGLKYLQRLEQDNRNQGRSREGAWIEILFNAF